MLVKKLTYKMKYEKRKYNKNFISNNITFYNFNSSILVKNT